MEKLKGAVIAIALWTGLIMMGDASALDEGRDHIIMEIDSDGISGSIMCESVSQCWVKVQYMEARGANEYCNSITIKRNGRIVWYKNYYK